MIRYALLAAIATLLTTDLRPIAAAEPRDEQAVSRMLFGSCIKQDQPMPIFRTMLERDPQLLLFLGDNIYADTTDMAVMRAKYATLAANEDFHAIRAACPVLATWDDHDYGQNDGGADFPQRAEAEEVFLEFWQVPSDSPRRQRAGVYDARVFGPPGKRLQVILLDTRFFRSPLARGERRVGGPYIPDEDPDKTMLGDEQWQWLERQLRVPAEVRVIASSIQCVASDAGQETWSNLPHERERLFQLIEQTGAGGVLILSGDRHWAELSVADQGVAYPLYDLTSSSFNQKHPRGTPTENRFRLIDKTYHEENFGELSIDWEQPDPVISMEIRDQQGAIQIEKSIQLSELQVPRQDVHDATGSQDASSGAQSRQTPRLTFKNPLKENGADPWLTFHNGWYYLTTTTGADIQMRRAKTLSGLRTAGDRVVWNDDTPGRSQAVWATEFHLLPNDSGDLRWYGYYTAAGDTEPSHRMYVIESEGTDPMGPYHFKAQVQTDANDEYYSIDGSPIVAADGSMYFVWCGRPSPHGQGLYIAKMTNPWTTVGQRVALQADGFGCEHVREGPIALRRNGRIFLVYSMCAANEPDYRLGMLIADDDADLTDPSAWAQHPEVVFARRDEAGVYGPGHNFFFQSPDGSEDWIVYHAKTTTEVTYQDRTARAQSFTWNDDGTPNFGRPLSTDTEIPEPSGTTAVDDEQPAPRKPE